MATGRQATDFAAALAGNPQARATFDGFAPSHRREYLQWITEAKRPETRTRRIETMLAWRSGLVEADADELVEHLTALGTALSPQFLQG